jgi:hypothetical protein
MAAPVPQNTNQPGMRSKVSVFHRYIRLSLYISLALTQKVKLIRLCFCLWESSRLASCQDSLIVTVGSRQLTAFNELQVKIQFCSRHCNTVFSRVIW